MANDTVNYLTLTPETVRQVWLDLCADTAKRFPQWSKRTCASNALMTIFNQISARLIRVIPEIGYSPSFKTTLVEGERFMRFWATHKSLLLALAEIEKDLAEQVFD